MVASINASTTAGVVTTADTSGILQLQTASTAALTIDASQNSTFAGSVKTNTLTSASATALTLQSAGTTAITVDTSQNVGIGTASPSQKLDIVGTTPFINIQGGANTNARGLQFNYNGSLVTGSLINYGGTGETALSGGTTSSSGYFLTFKTDGTERMRITSAGDLVVGKTSTGSGTQGFGVYSTGEIEANAGTNPAAYFNRTNDGTIMQFRRSGTTVGTISVTTSATAYNTSSDYRLKEAIAPMTGALTKVALLKPCTYKWKVDGSDGQGFIAHELQEVVEGCVTGEKDAVDADGNPVHQGIDTSFLVATLTAALQETKALIDTQAELISGQAATINALVTRIEALESK